LIRFYEKHNPSKVDTVDATLEKYKGKEDELFRKVEAKYAPQPKTPKFPPPAGSGPRCYLEFSIGNEPSRRIVVKLYKDKAQLAAENFRCLCTGEITTHKVAGKPLRYLGSKVHRIVPGFCIQAGDFTAGNGRGGASIYAPNSEHGDAWGKFQDEPAGFMDHSRKGLLSMANSGKNTNSSQFFFTLKAVPYLNGKHVVFGEVEEGMDALEELGKVETNKSDRPIEDMVISACGEIDSSGKDIPSLGSGNDAQSSSPASAPFGIAASAAPVFGSSSGAFGSSAKGGSTFGKTGTPAFSGGSSVFGPSTGTTGATLFGGGTFGSSAGKAGTPMFGGDKSTFGASAAKTATPVFGGGASTFGSSAASGSTTFRGIKSATPVFGTTTASTQGGATFGTIQSANPVFGTTTASATSTSASGSTTPVFGSPSRLGSKTTPVFGTPNHMKPTVSSSNKSPGPGGYWTLSEPGVTRSPSSVFGTPSLLGTASSSNKKKSPPKPSPSIFGSAAGGASVFGGSQETTGFGDLAASTSKSDRPVFGSGSNTGGFGSLACKPSVFGSSANSAFGSKANQDRSGNNNPSPFAAFSSSTPGKGFSFGSSK
jgi:cyclophilin family peptidyl-prolyl cis-trans isomerase